MGYTEEDFDEMTIFDLRNYARSVGVKSPTSKNRKKLMFEIHAISNGDLEPFFPVKPQGRPRKNVEHLIPSTNTIDNIIETTFLQLHNIENNEMSNLAFSSTVEKDATSINAQKFKVEGYLSINQGQNVLYDFSFLTHILKSATLSNELIINNELKNGDFIVANAITINGCDYPEVVELICVNGNEDFYDDTIPTLERVFEKTTKDLIITHCENSNGYDIALNLMLPMCIGDKIIIVNNDNKMLDKTFTFLNAMPSDMEKVIVLTNAMPNLVAEARSMQSVKLFYSFFGSSEEQQKFIVNLALDSAKRMCDNGKKVLTLIYDISEFVDESISNSDNAINIYNNIFSRAMKTDNSSLTIVTNMSEGVFKQYKQNFDKFIDVVINVTECAKNHINLLDSYSSNCHLLPDKIKDLKKIIDGELRFIMDKDSNRIWDIFNIKDGLVLNSGKIHHKKGKKNNANLHE